MLLRVHSDASHLSRSKSGSVAGGIYYLGTSDPYFINAPIHCHSTGIPVVCAAVSESEYARVFSNAQIGADERTCLASLGYSQPPIVIFCDNECAVGLASSTVRAKKSKSIDMRFDWIQDRVRQLQFQVSFIPGAINLADFFTKALSVEKHVEVSSVYVTYEWPCFDDEWRSQMDSVNLGENREGTTQSYHSTVIIPVSPLAGLKR